MTQPTGTAIRQALSDQLSLTSKDVSVRSSRGGGANVHVLRDGIDFAAVERIAKGFASVRYDEATGCILRGGNTFVFCYDYEPMDAVEMKIESTGKRVKMYGSTPGGWFERGFVNAEKARRHAERKGWTIAA